MQSKEQSPLSCNKEPLYGTELKEEEKEDRLSIDVDSYGSENE